MTEGEQGEFRDGGEIDRARSFRTEGSVLTVVEQLHFHHAGGAAPTAVETSWHRKMRVDEQAWVRHLRVGESWRPLADGCWFGRASAIHVENVEGKRLQVIPTGAEAAATAAKVVEVGGPSGPTWLVRPGETFRGQPSDLAGLQVRCWSGEARIVVTVTPGD